MSVKNQSLVIADSTETSISNVQGSSINQDFMSLMESENAGTLEEIINKAKSAKDKKKMALNIADQYLILEQGEVHRMYFMGFIFKDYPEKPEPLKCAVLVDDNSNLFTYGAAQFVGVLEDKNLMIGTGVEFSWTGLKKTAKGFMRLHTINPLLD
jgi:hypothetical protein